MEILKYFQPWQPAGIPLTEMYVPMVERVPETRAHKNSKGIQADVGGAVSPSYSTLIQVCLSQVHSASPSGGWIVTISRRKDFQEKG